MNSKIGLRHAATAAAWPLFHAAVFLENTLDSSNKPGEPAEGRKLLHAGFFIYSATSETSLNHRAKVRSLHKCMVRNDIDSLSAASK